jgi:hypothetical protein
LKGEEKRASVQLGTLKPAWDEELRFRVAEGAEEAAVDVELWDRKVGGTDEIIGRAVLKTGEEVNTKRHERVVFVDESGKEMGTVELNVLMNDSSGEHDMVMEIQESVAVFEVVKTDEKKKEEEEKKEVEGDGGREGKEEKKEAAEKGEKNEEEEKEDVRELRINVQSGKVYEKQDLIGKGDPYVILRWKGKEKRTSTLKNTQTPVWNEGFLLCCCLSNRMGVNVNVRIV